MKTGTRSFHRILSVLLAVMMLLSTGILTAFAADEEAETTTPTLADGEYIVSVQNWGGYATNDKTTTKTSISASPRALLSVKDGTIPLH